MSFPCYPLFACRLSLLLLVGLLPAAVEAQVYALPASSASAGRPVLDDTVEFVEFEPQVADVPFGPPGLGILGFGPRGFGSDYWTWQVVPSGLMFRSYLASGREARFASQWMSGHELGWVWDIALGGRAAIIRFGDQDPAWPEGIELDIEGVAFPRLAVDENCDLVAADFRFGVPLAFRRGIWEGKFAYYHLSSHLGDEYLLRHPTATRINYARDVLLVALAVRPTDQLRFYVEVGWAWYAHEGSEPWEFQFGIEYSETRPTGLIGSPFFAINGRLRQEVDYGGNMAVEAGWQWRGDTGRLCRVGLRYFNGMSDQYEFVDQFEQLVGFGIWYDF